MKYEKDMIPPVPIEEMRSVNFRKEYERHAIPFSGR